MRQEIEQTIAGVCKELFDIETDVELTRSDEQFGDYATNLALQLASRLNNPLYSGPREIADSLVKELSSALAGQVSELTVAGPGFINLRLTDAGLLKLAEVEPARPLAGQTIVAEYSDPNPFKVLHAGHLYTSVVGDAIANLLETAGGEVHRVNFGGDVGLHVAKNMWAIITFLGGEKPEKLQDIDESQRAEWLSERYVEGHEAYGNNESAKAEIMALNKRIYQLHDDNDHDSPLAQIYWTARKWSYDYFDKFYARIGSKFEKYYPESQTAPIGLKTVKEQLEKGTYQKSDGAIVFDGEKYGLHTRVFINSEGLPTYEAKDVGLIMAKWQDYHFDRSIIITGNDIVEYMKVVLKSIEQFMPDLAKATTHLTHGIVKLKGGEKMSSRKGNILRAVDVLETATQANREATGKDNDQAVLAAVKYAFLKQRIGGDIIYNPAESVSLLGNSGPYIQYAHARARSILAKSKVTPSTGSGSSKSPKSKALDSKLWTLSSDERSLLRKIGEYPEVVEKAVQDLLPSHICTYLYELAQTFNRFYEHNRVIGDDREAIRIYLVNLYANTLKRGLGLLSIPAPENM